MKKRENIEVQLITNSNSNQTDQVSLEKLVPDKIFASVLNENAEIQIDNTVYKVTKYGTFMIPTDKLGRVNDLVKIWDSKSSNQSNMSVQSIKGNNYQDTERYSPYANADIVYDNFYSIEQNIYLYDTYGYTDGNNPDFYEPDVIESRYTSPDYIQNFTIDEADYLSVWSNPFEISGTPNQNIYEIQNTENHIYNNLATFNFGAKTLGGKLIEAIRGRDEVYTVNFSDNNRIRVNFYDASYIIYSALGVSAKMQKKNWIGWSGTNADELRIGWDAIQYDAGWSLSFTPPSSSYVSPYSKPSYYEVDVPGSKHKFALFDLTALGYRIKPIISYNSNEVTQKAIKFAYDQARSLLRPNEISAVSNKPFAFLTYAEVFNDKRIVTVGKDEERSNNNETMRRTFDWRTGTLKLTFNLGTGEFSPSGEIAKEFELDQASVYGIAKFANQWKGVRIVYKGD